ncbi:hypothetical protein Vafri_3918 [Volvox africanus]|uniref:Uncharacterized protein n=1 Tax=Volvox africanus TaxID=51714 RepID=A0A8J4AWF6_9CHLO|nr:hypothetical protein Vafri_3918 [Volvox africanus]
MSPSAASLASHPLLACEPDRFAAASILLSMSHEEPPQQDVETSDEQHNSSDGANASRKGQPWTEEEHLAFLQGLRKLGKGNWRAIARQFVPSRTPTQVASHAQKHFMRIAGATKRKSRFTTLETEAGAPAKAIQANESNEVQQTNRQCPEQPGTLQPASFQGMSAPFPAMPFPFMPPMMFPGPFFPPFLYPPPAFAASALPKQGHVPMMMPPMFPMAAAMMGMNSFFMAQQMVAAAQAAAANAAAVMQAATSGGGTTAGTGPTATADTANSDEVQRRTQSVAPGSPTICKPEAQHARPSMAVPSSAAAAVASGPALACGAGRNSSSGGAGESTALDKLRTAGSSLQEHVQYTLTAPGPPRQDDGGSSFHTSSHSAFRPPQEVKSES